VAHPPSRAIQSDRAEQGLFIPYQVVRFLLHFSLVTITI
jgi:hypothetical protein